MQSTNKNLTYSDLNRYSFIKKIQNKTVCDEGITFNGKAYNILFLDKVPHKYHPKRQCFAMFKKLSVNVKLFKHYCLRFCLKLQDLKRDSLNIKEL